MEVYRALARASVLLMIAPVLWLVLELNGKRPDAFLLVAFPSLWIFIFGTLTLLAMRLELYRTVGMRIIAAGQLLCVSVQLGMTIAAVGGIIGVHLENSLIPIASGQLVVLIGLLVRRFESEPEPATRIAS